MTETNLSTFLHIVHDCIDDTNKISGQEMVRQLLVIQGSDVYGDEKIKSIYTGARPIIPSDIEEYTKKDKVKEFKEYFEDLLDKNKTLLLFAKFGIEEDEKVDFSLMCEAIAMQYQNFTRYGDLANTTVKSIYEVIIDSKGYAADPNANEKAVKAAYQMLFNAINNLCRINPILDQLSDVKEPIESFLQNISQVYSVLFARMNRVGRITYKSLREKHIRKNPNADKYIKMASEPGALPIELMRRVVITAYNFPHFDDFCISTELNMDDDFTKQDLMDGLETIDELKDYIEIFFTEFMHYHLANEEDDIVSDVYVLTRISKDFLKHLAKELSIIIDKDFMKKLIEKYEDAQSKLIAFAFDGSYYRPTKTVKYAVNFEQMFFDEEGNIELTGDKKIPFQKSKYDYYFGETFDETVRNFTAHQIAMYQDFKDDPMNEILVINADKTYRLYMFVTTCKAKMYRKIREISIRAAMDHAVCVMIQTITVGRDFDKDLMLLPAEERIVAPGGHDILSIFSALWNKIRTDEFLGSDLKSGVIKKLKSKIDNFIFRPLVTTLLAVKSEGYSYSSVFKDEDPLK